MAGRKPTHRVCVVDKGEDGRGDPFYSDVGAGWAFDGQKAAGVSVKLRPGIAVMGEFVLFENKD